MKNEPSQSSDFFGSSLIDLSFKADRESKAFTSRLLWENLALKVVTKLKLLVDRGFNHAVKRRIESKLRNKQALTPHDLLMYRAESWEKAGSRNYKKIIQAIDQSIRPNGNQAADLKSESFQNLFLEKLVDLKKQGKLKLIESTHTLKKITKGDDFYLFIDNYYFKNGGHIAVLEQTIDNLQSGNDNIVFVFLLDKKLILFPQLSSLILKKCGKKIIFDTTKFPIRLASDPQTHSTIRALAANSSVKLDGSIITTDSIFNPSIAWKNYPYGSQGQPQKAWPTAFHRDGSINILNHTLKRLSISPIHKPYVVIHSRNSILMSDNIRNSKPLKDRAKLFGDIIDMGLQVIVLGVMDPSSKFKHPNVIYTDELGPISDALQIHILNGAIGVIGSPSGITHLTYCTDTPLLLIDMPCPFCNYYPGTNMKALLKKLERNNEKISLAKYYEYDQLPYTEEVRDHRAFSPLHQEEIQLKCNSDGAILHAFKELLLETYKPSELQDLTMHKPQNYIDSKSAARDRSEISLALTTCKKESDIHPYFEVRDLSTANWFDDSFLAD